MSSFAPGDRVHVARLGTGTVLDARNGGRYLVEIKGRALVVDGARLESAAADQSRRRTAQEAVPDVTVSSPTQQGGFSLDLHGKTAAEALDALDAFLSDALLDGATEARVVHGRSGGVVKAAVHKRLTQLPPVRSFRVDPRNAGVTIVTF